MRVYGNVLHFMCYNAPYSGNFISSLIALESRLKKDNVGMVYLFEKETSDRDWAKQLSMKGKNIYFLNGKKINDLLLIHKIIKSHNIKIIHTHFTGVKYHSLFNIIRFFFDSKILLISHLHNHYKRKVFVKRLVINIISRIDFYIGCGKSVAEHYQKINKVNRNKIAYVTNAIDFSRLNNFELLDKSVYSISSKTKIILMFGFDYYRKGVDIAIEALYKIAIEKNLCLVLALSKNIDTIIIKIKERFQKVPNWIKILDPRDDIASYYHLSDIFISPSRSEGLCFSLIEAAYCEILLVASDIPGHSLEIPKIFKFPPEDVLKLRNQILAAFSLKEEEKIKITSIQKDFVVKNYDLKVWAEKIVLLYKSLNSI